jgi:hypothetical protein
MSEVISGFFSVPPAYSGTPSKTDNDCVLPGYFTFAIHPILWHCVAPGQSAPLNNLQTNFVRGLNWGCLNNFIWVCVVWYNPGFTRMPKIQTDKISKKRKIIFLKFGTSYKNFYTGYKMFIQIRHEILFETFFCPWICLEVLQKSTKILRIIGVLFKPKISRILVYSVATLLTRWVC